MKNLSLALILLTTLSINLSPAQAVNKQAEIGMNNESNSQKNKISNSTNTKCYWIGIPLCK